MSIFRGPGGIKEMEDFGIAILLVLGLIVLAMHVSLYFYAPSH